LPLLDDVTHRLRRVALHLPARRSRQNVNLFLREPLASYLWFGRFGCAVGGSTPHDPLLIALKGSMMHQHNKACTILAILLFGTSMDGMFARQGGIPEQRPAANGNQEMSADGAWCWFADPRAVYYEGRQRRTYAGWVNSYGDIQVGAYDHRTGITEISTLKAKLERDDHANPAILIRPDRRLQVFYSSHGGRTMWYRVSNKPEDISAWARETEISTNIEGSHGFTYPNPCLLAKENNRIYLFWRGGDFLPDFSTSLDGTNWTAARTFIKGGQRPYVKYESDGQSTIHLAFTDGHPRNEEFNSIYYACYQNGALYKANGDRIKSVNELPLVPAEAERVYDARSHNARAWIWDIALDARNHPVIVYASFPDEKTHNYRYARWNGNQWDDYEITNAGPWFPKTPGGKQEPEPHYSAGIVLDHTDPSTVYLSRLVDRVFEIEKCASTDGGKTWSSNFITHGSQLDNVRPVAVRDRKPGQAPSVLWMQNSRYVHYTDYKSAIKMNVPYPYPPSLSDKMRRAQIMTAMQKVADWQLAHPGDHPPLDWTQGALYAGMTAWGELSSDPRYLKAMRDVGEAGQWALGRRIYHADDHCVGQMYLSLYDRYRDRAMIDPLLERFDYILANPSSATLQTGAQKNMDRWWWCDALFMAPPVWTRLSTVTGNRKYIDFMNREFWATHEYLYSPEEHLFFRDDTYFRQSEANGKPIFWSRGNGWVLAGIARVLQFMPANYPDRPRYVKLFMEMAEKVMAIQPKDGLWRPSLLNPARYPEPETSGSGFYCYGLAWGINNGLLERAKYLPAVQRAWAGLVRAVHPDGKLGSVQPIGASPRTVSPDLTEVYGVGAFLLAGAEVCKLVK
jgi:rhamnogalacturonyl hydrolase YesR